MSKGDLFRAQNTERLPADVEIATVVSAVNDTAFLVLPEVVGKRHYITGISGGFTPQVAAGAERNLSLTFDETTVGRWPTALMSHIPFDPPLKAPTGDGAGAGDVKVQLGAGGSGVTGHCTITYVTL